MNKQTFALLSFLVVITAALVFFAVSQPSEKTQVTPEPTTIAAQPTPSLIQTTMSLSPNPVEVSSNSGSVDVNIDSSVNNITGVQLELSYDPNVLTNVKLAPASFFDTPSVLINNIDDKNGKISYAIVIPPTGASKKGTGVVATMTFGIKRGATASQTQIQFLPKSLVTAEGLAYSVLKSTSDTTVIISK